MKTISLLLPDLRAGGAERVNLDLAREFSRKGYKVEFVVRRNRGELLEQAQDSYPVVSLDCAQSQGSASGSQAPSSNPKTGRTDRFHVAIDGSRTVSASDLWRTLLHCLRRAWHPIRTISHMGRLAWPCPPDQHDFRLSPSGCAGRRFQRRSIRHGKAFAHGAVEILGHKQPSPEQTGTIGGCAIRSRAALEHPAGLPHTYRWAAQGGQKLSITPASVLPNTSTPGPTDVCRRRRRSALCGNLPAILKLPIKLSSLGIKPTRRRSIPRPICSSCPRIAKALAMSSLKRLHVASPSYRPIAILVLAKSFWMGNTARLPPWETRMLLRWR